MITVDGAPTPAQAWLLDLFDWLDRRTYVLDGISGTPCHRTLTSPWLHGRCFHSLYHEPDTAGRQTLFYRDLRARLGDDWSSDLTHSERVIGIALELGYEAPAHPLQEVAGG